MDSFLNELKRRNIFRAAAAYAVAAWVLAQAAGLVLPAFDAPAWTLRAVFAVLAFGFPLVVAAAWLYEITPRGLRRTRSERRSDNNNAPRIIDSVTIIALVFAVVLVGIGRDGWVIGMELITAKDVSAILDSNEDSERIAVFPFSSAHTDLDSKLIAEGLAVALADRVQAARGIETIGMRSTLLFEQHPETMSAVGDALEVDRIVEGSLRRDGDLYTITVQLVEVASREPLLTRTEEVPPAQFEQALDRMAGDIISALGARAPETRDRSGGFEPEEMVDWMRVLGSLLRESPEDLARAHDIAAELVEKAPKSGEARAASGYTTLMLARLNSTDFEARARKAKDLLDQAISLAPESRYVLRWRTEAESLIVRWRARAADYRRVHTDLEHALELFPGDPALLAIRARHCAAFGDHARAVDFARNARSANPLDHGLHRVIVDSLLALGRAEQAAKMVDELEKHPVSRDAIAAMEARIALANDQTNVALQRFADITTPDRSNLLFGVRLHASRSGVDDARSLLDNNAGALGDGLIDAWQASLAGDHDAAYRHARKALEADAPDEALMLGQMAAQAGAFEDAVATFDRRFSNWINDSGPLLGPVAWIYAPWYALALQETGRQQDARRLLDRHLAGVLSVESTLEPATRNLYLAANHSVAGRPADAATRLEKALQRGMVRTHGVMGGLHPLASSRLLGETVQHPTVQLVLESSGSPAVQEAGTR